MNNRQYSDQHFFYFGIFAPCDSAKIYLNPGLPAEICGRRKYQQRLSIAYWASRALPAAAGLLGVVAGFWLAVAWGVEGLIFEAEHSPKTVAERLAQQNNPSSRPVFNAEEAISADWFLVFLLNVAIYSLVAALVLLLSGSILRRWTVRSIGHQATRTLGITRKSAIELWSALARLNNSEHRAEYERAKAIATDLLKFDQDLWLSPPLGSRQIIREKLSAATISLEVFLHEKRADSQDRELADSGISHPAVRTVAERYHQLVLLREDLLARAESDLAALKEIRPLIRKEQKKLVDLVRARRIEADELRQIQAAQKKIARAERALSKSDQ